MKFKKLFIFLSLIIVGILSSCGLEYRNPFAQSTTTSETTTSSKVTSETTTSSKATSSSNVSSESTSTTSEYLTSDITTISKSGDGIDEGIIYDDFKIEFLTFNTESAGDSIYIKAGETDILIDAGNKNNNASYLKSQIDEYCDDNKLEYVIVTHGDQDHITSFHGNTFDASGNGLLYTYDVDNIIINEQTTKTTQTYKKLLSAIDYCISQGATRTYAADFFESDHLTAKSSDTIQLSDKVSMTILWNKYYFSKDSDENNNSVCTLFTYKNNNEEHNFILTGDLEEAGEKNLVEHYNGGAYGSLPEVDLYKGGHHGSKTSSTMSFLNVIKPKICCVCTCAGTNEYTTDYANQFPTQQFVSRIAQFTERVYVTGLYKNGKMGEMNGRIVVSCHTAANGSVEIGIAASNNLTKLKDSEWFNETIYVTNYKAATSTNLDDVDSCPHGYNSAKTNDETFYTASTANVVQVVRRIWPTI